jgi:hypothetical protein
MWRAQHSGLQGARLNSQIISVGAATTEQGVVFQPLQALAYKWHGIGSLGKDCLQICLLVPITGTLVLLEQVSGKDLQSTNA